MQSKEVLSNDLLMEMAKVGKSVYVCLISGRFAFFGNLDEITFV